MSHGNWALSGEVLIVCSYVSEVCKAMAKAGFSPATSNLVPAQCQFSALYQLSDLSGFDGHLDNENESAGLQPASSMGIAIS
jgi:hypothetical protein